MDFDLAPDIQTPTEIINQYFPSGVLLFPQKEFWQYIKNNVHEFPYFLVSILSDLYRYEHVQDIPIISPDFRDMIIVLSRNIYIDSALQANYRMSMEIAYGMEYDETRRDFLEKI